MADAVGDQLREAEAIATSLGRGGNPQEVPAPAAILFLERDVTLNQSFVAAVNASIASPERVVTLGPKYDSSHHAGWGRPGERITCLEAGRRAIRYQVEVSGPHSGREQWGYVNMYLTGAALAAAHPGAECRELGRVLLAQMIACYSLMEGWRMGCRSGLTIDQNIVDALAMARGEVPQVSGEEWRTGGRVLLAVRELVGTLSDYSQKGAVGFLIDTNARSLVGWRWAARPDGWAAEIIAPSECIKKNTGPALRIESKAGEVVVTSERMWLPAEHGLWAELSPEGCRGSFARSSQEPPEEPEPEPEEEDEEPPRWTRFYASRQEALKAWRKAGKPEKSLQRWLKSRPLPK